MTPSSERYYTIEDVVELTQMGKDWLWEQCREKKIPHHRFGTKQRPHYRFTAEDLAALRAKTAVVPETADPLAELVPTGPRR